MTAVSRIFGLIRTLLFSQILGASLIADAFFLAFKIPNLFRRSFAEGSMSAGFIPIFTRLVNPQDKTSNKASSDFFKQIFTLLCFIMLIVLSLSSFFAKDIVTFFYWLKPSYLDEVSIELPTRLLQIMFPYLFFISLTAIFQGVMNSYGQFTRPAFTPILFNLTIISSAFFILFFSKLSEEKASILLGISVSLGGFFQAGYLYSYVRKLGYRLRFKWFGASKEVGDFFHLVLPVFFSASFYQINQILLDPLALYSGEGGLSALLYSVRIQELPLGVIVISISTVFLAKFSFLAKESNWEEFGDKLTKSLFFLCLVITPVVFLAIISNQEIVSLLFYSEKINRSKSALISSCLLFQLIAIFPIALSRIYQAVFFSLKDSKTTVVYGLISMFFNLALASILVLVYRQDASSIAVSSLLSATLYAFLLHFGLSKNIKKHLNRKVFSLTLKMILYCAVSAFLARFFSSLFLMPIDFNPQSVVATKTLALASITLKSVFFLAGLAFFLYLDNPKELRAILNELQNRIRKKN